MKKTLTVNLGGRVYHIDEDAYQLLDNYLSNLRLYFRKQEGAEEIVADMEIRISELFSEKIIEGYQVITITDVEEIIARMGKPEDLAGFAHAEEAASSGSYSQQTTKTTTRRKLFRDPDNKMLGGVVSGLAAYIGWDVTLLRLLLLVILICGVGTLIPVYIVCWLVIPEARTAAEKLSMRGEEVTIENIGKTVTDGFDKMANGVNNFVKSDKPRTFFQKAADVIVSIFGVLLKICLVVLIIVFSPVLLALAFALFIMIVVLVGCLIGGGAALFEMAPFMDGVYFSGEPITTIVSGFTLIILIGLPLFSLVFTILRSLFKWSPMSTGLKWTLLIFWFITLIVFYCSMVEMNWTLPLIRW